MGEDPIASETTTPVSIPDPVADGTQNDISDGATKDPAENAVFPNTEEPKDDADASHGGPPLPVYIPPGSNDLPAEERVAKPGVRYYNYQGYMNRLNSGGEDFGIEVLVTGTDWHEEISIESNKRWEPSEPPPPPVAAQPPATTIQQSEQPTVDVSNPPPKQPSPPLHVENPTLGDVPQYIRNRVSEYLAVDPLEKKYSFSDKIDFSSGSESVLEGRIRRVRVRNPTIIAALGAASGCTHLSSDKSAFEFHRPFRIIEECHSEMKKKLAEMENIHSESVSSSGTAPAENITLASQDAASPEESPKATSELTPGEVAPEGKEEGLQFTMEDLEHMRQYVDFVEKIILPIRGTFQYAGQKAPPRVCLEDIPYLFKPGSLVIVTEKARSGKTLHRSAVQRIWRLVSCQPSDVRSGTTTYEEEDESNEYTNTTWSMYSLDYDGEVLVPVWKSFRFKRFDGERDITSLGCYPLEFDPRGAKILEEQKISGERFKKCLSGKWKHFFYLGWTFITGLRAEALEDEKGCLIQHPEYIESEIVVDFKETLQSYPGWETEQLAQSLARNGWDWEASAQHHLRIWEEGRKGSHGRRRYRVVHSPILIEESELYRREADKWQEQDVFLSGKADFKSKDWSAEDLALLPQRVFAYVLRERRFARLDVGGIDLDTEQSKVTLDDIQMDQKRRKMIRSSVSAHFRDKSKPSTSELDMFRGKGKGLVILLHGAPGVGKTATAEAVAAENNRPLFPITCGDLGFSPGEVDKALRDIFRYAHLWTCILLFDEADVFLTQRDRSGGNLERNALVGVFLRVLEYYSGILFMTTNRVGALDEAFQSRVHLSLSYPNLSLDDTIEILRFNLDRLPRINKAEGKTAQGGYLKIFDKKIIEYVSKEYKDYSARTKKDRGPWNGRQIRNAVQIAAGLALYEKQTGSGDNDDEDDPPYLTAEHFRTVADMTYEFEDYLSLAGKGDAQVQATRRRDRADQFHGREDQRREVDMEVIGVTILPLEVAVTHQVQELPSAETAVQRLDRLERLVKISAQTRGNLLETLAERRSALVRVKFPALL
ncbi:putative cell division cycle ATPase [Colletotrichum siamense]|nr:putative cell division cycle ATPase [Colletotrichum siamense]